MEQIDFVMMAYLTAFVCLGGGALFLLLMNHRVAKRLKALEDSQ